MAGLSTAGMVALTTCQVATLTTAQWAALTTAQIHALSTTQTQAYGTFSTPMVLDLNNDGIKTLGVSEGVSFDIFADGTKVNTGWVSSGDGLLVLDRNNDGSINDGSELFGSSTTLSGGVRATDGYAALRELDANQDGVISQSDKIFDDLCVWVDSNSNGATESGEIKTLASLGITQINLQASVGLEIDNGNVLGLVSTYETTDGATHAAADVWFSTDRLADSSSSIASSPGSGTGGDEPASAQDPATVPTLAKDIPVDSPLPDITAAIPIGAISDLRSRVSSIAQAISSFGSASETGDVEPMLRNDSGIQSAGSALVAVNNMADTMKQFDGNGNLLAKAMTASVPSTTSLNLPGVQNPGSDGFLAVAGK